jgi:tetratricopeptide (TPR) repeat protein
MGYEPPKSEEPSGNEDRRAARALLDAAMDSEASGLAAVEEAIGRLEGSDEPDQEALVTLLHAKCRYLSGADRLVEALAICDRELEVSDEPKTGFTKDLALEAFLVRASLLGRLERPEEALETASAVAEAIALAGGSAEGLDPRLRSLGVWAAQLRLQQLVVLGRLDEATETWAVLLESSGTDSETSIRAQVALAGGEAAALLADQKKWGQALRVADQVIGRFGESEEPKVRAGVALAMGARVVALRGRGRLLAGTRAGSELVSFLGPEPEPEVIRALSGVPGGERWIGLARRYESA